MATVEKETRPESFHQMITSKLKDLAIPAFMADLARLEWACHLVDQDPTTLENDSADKSVNPTLSLIPVDWKYLEHLVKSKLDAGFREPEPFKTHIAVYRHPADGDLQIHEAEDIDLLALKIVVEQIPVKEAAVQGHINPDAINQALSNACAKGLLIAPKSRIRRTFASPIPQGKEMASFLSADLFTLQWHLTQECDLKCRHCYDRSVRKSLPLEKALLVLDDFESFCRQMRVEGRITFTGGNPLLYPHFMEIYQATAERGLGAAILGNPTPIDQMQQLVAIARPEYFQISLEGLETYNDYIRGRGHFRRSIQFLEQLTDLHIYSIVMLTLNRDNLEQVLPLAQKIEKYADAFSWNRLSTVGEGAQLLMPTKEAFEGFLRAYEAAARENPFLTLKDNLTNIVRLEEGRPPFGGCTGYGCGAAFNFMALLPDGEVHACRKFPSLIGHIDQSSLFDVYHSPQAALYRQGPDECRDCRLKIACRGCLAISYSLGQDIFKTKDPFCFIPSGSNG